ncbi:MAG: hypothetical protein GEU88_04235 [Solirubrobacterales bacterium]|nr:hypothetical protein [Solirubrobacterales bacterium]
MTEVPRELLERRWVHAHEEDTDDEMVFRPAEHPLPPSRGRTSFELRPDGSFSEAGLGAADVPDEAEGTWRLDGGTIVLGEGAPGGAPRAMPVASLDEHRLVIRR